MMSNNIYKAIVIATCLIFGIAGWFATGFIELHLLELTPLDAEWVINNLSGEAEQVFTFKNKLIGALVAFSSCACALATGALAKAINNPVENVLIDHLIIKQ